MNKKYLIISLDDSNEDESLNLLVECYKFKHSTQLYTRDEIIEWFYEECVLNRFEYGYFICFFEFDLDLDQHNKFLSWLLLQYPQYQLYDIVDDYSSQIKISR